MKGLPSSLWTHHASNLHLAYPQKEKTMTPPEGLPPQKTMHETFGKPIGSDGPKLVPLPEEDAKPFDNCDHCQSLVCNDLGRCCDPKEDAKTEGEAPKITARLLKAIRGLTADVPHRAFDPDWFIIGEEIKEIETSLTAARAEVERWEKAVDHHATIALEAAAECDALREENRRLREALEFYADPETYHAIMILADRPCGDFADDFSQDEITEDLGYERPMPGKYAREVLLPAAPESKGGEDE